MRIHVIQHVTFEGPGFIANWAEMRGHVLTTSFAFTEHFPDPDEVDFLIVMGGPMDADDEVASPWLSAEKRAIARVIASGRPVLGVCLGSQILAEVLGGKVKRGREPEIGWYPVTLTETGSEEPLFARWPDSVVVGHWHGDTFDLPLGFDAALSSQVTPNQAFVFDGHAVGIQFHLEWDAESIAMLLRACGSDLLLGGPHVATAGEFAEQAVARMPECHELLVGLLDHMAALEGEAASSDGYETR